VLSARWCHADTLPRATLSATSSAMRMVWRRLALGWYISGLWPERPEKPGSCVGLFRSLKAIAFLALRPVTLEPYDLRYGAASKGCRGVWARRTVCVAVALVSPRPKKAIQSLCPAGFTPACGSDVWPLARLLSAWLKPGPSGLCLNKLFAPFDLIHSRV